MPIQTEGRTEVPLLIDSAPECIKAAGNSSPDAADTADFIVQGPYADCAGIMTFGPGSTYGPDGVAAATSYYILTAIGMAFFVIILIAWVWYENYRLKSHVERIVTNGAGPAPGRHAVEPGTTPYQP